MSEGTEENKFDLSRFITDDVLKWLAGGVDQPESIRKMGDDLATKMNWFLALSVLSSYSRLPKLIAARKKLEDQLYSEESINDIMTSHIDDPAELAALNDKVSKEIGGVLEFARKFIVQNKDYLTNDSTFFDRSLYEKIKAMPTDMVRDYLTLFSIIEKRGTNLLKEIIENYE